MVSPQSDVQTFTIGVLPQIPGFPQLAPDCDLQISVRDQYFQSEYLEVHRDWKFEKRLDLYFYTFYIPHPPVCVFM